MVGSLIFCAAVLVISIWDRHFFEKQVRHIDLYSAYLRLTMPSAFKMYGRALSAF